MVTVEFNAAWTTHCMLVKIPSTASGTVELDVWVGGVKYFDMPSDSIVAVASDSMQNRYLEKWTSYRNGRLLWVDPAQDTVVRTSDTYVHSGRVEIYSNKPATGCG